MCGIVGFFSGRRSGSLEHDTRRITSMVASIVHRGPDSGGIWIDPEAGLSLGHRRLAIRELSEAGHQPMLDASGRHVLILDGEVYNAGELRDQLAQEHGIRFVGHSDAEVILNGCVVWGVEKLAGRLNGMFAFSFWDADLRRLTLVRDQFGVKPLYWRYDRGNFSFAPELKALRAAWAIDGGASPELNLDALALFIRHSYIAAPLSIYCGINKLPAGCLLELESGGKPEVRKYWDAREVFRDGRRLPYTGNWQNAADELEELLQDAVNRQMTADVPVGAFLSGGVDSSLVTALMQKSSSRPVKTFCVGFEEAAFNEAHYAKAVAEHLGTEHHEEYLSPAQVMDAIPRMPEFYDEPFGDASQLPTYLLSLMTRKHVRVALSGDAGDEFFAGYKHYSHPIAAVLGCSGWKQKALKAGVHLLSPAVWDVIGKALPESIVSAQRKNNFGTRLYRKVNGLQGDFLANYRAFLSICDPFNFVPGAADYPGIFGDMTLTQQAPANLDLMQFVDSLTYMVDDVLTKVDRATMAAGLESRAPFLDTRVYAFAWRLPLGMRLAEGKNKWLLRQILRRYVPDALVDRPKMGFSVPTYDWLRGSLRGWGEELLFSGRLKEAGFINIDTVKSAWERLQKGENTDRELWNVLMFQAWMDTEKRFDVNAPTPVMADVKLEIARGA